MDEDLIHKLYNELCRIISNHTQIEEIGFLTSLDIYNESFNNELDDQYKEYLFYSENRLAIKMKIIPYLFKLTHQYFHELLKDEDLVKLDINTKIYIILNSKNYTVWNRRKELIESCKTDVHNKLHEELKFIDLVQTKSPKSWEVWAHRRWVLKKMEKIDIDHELKVIDKASIMHKRNYYSWSHRLHLLENMNMTEIKCEINRIITWRSKHISDCSSLYYLYTLLLKEPELRLQYLDSEFSKSEQYINMYPQRSSWWIYRRHLWDLYLNCMSNYNDGAFRDVSKKIEEEEQIVNQHDPPIFGHTEWILNMIITLDWKLNEPSNKLDIESYRQRTQKYLKNRNEIKEDNFSEHY